MSNLSNALPDPVLMAQLCVITLAIIVAWDAWWLTKQRLHIPKLGNISETVYAWESNQAEEVSRQWANMMTVGAMMALPWALAELSDTPTIYVWVWDILLALHLISLLLPKRYAVTTTHLFADGQKYEWTRLSLPKNSLRNESCYCARVGSIWTPCPLAAIEATLMSQCLVFRLF